MTINFAENRRAPDSDEEYTVDESSPNLLKDHELFKDESYVPHKIIRVKRVNITKGAEDWKIMEDNQAVLVLKGSRFTNKEKEFLRTPEGFRFIVDGYKDGWRSINKFKQNMEVK